MLDAQSPAYEEQVERIKRKELNDKIRKLATLLSGYPNSAVWLVLKMEGLEEGGFHLIDSPFVHFITPHVTPYKLQYI